MAKNNPYIGPRTFQRNEGHLFFGREREARDLIALAASERLVVFYAQSGAGKSSIINTRLIPNLESKGYEVLPVGRLSGNLTTGEDAANIYIHNLIRSLEQHDTDPKTLASLTLSDFLAHLNYDEKGFFYDPTPPEVAPASDPADVARRVLIIDQFEELFSTYPESWGKREYFFEQLAQAMEDDPQLWVVLVMREDYLAALDPYAHLASNGLRCRYYMQRLGHEAALQAVQSPVAGLRPYTEGVADKLIDDLCSIKVQRPDGTLAMQPGQYVEPVQLQVVCYGLWENLPDAGTQITAKDLQEVGDVNQSLGKYYDKRVSEVAKNKRVKERLIREWFEKKLITAGGIRNMVLQESASKPDELHDDVIQALQSDLVRAEKRGGATWYELTHDRLVEPILERNQIWFNENLSPLQRQAALWQDQDENDSWLLRDRALTEVKAWASEHLDEITNKEKKFLEACEKLADVVQAQAKAERRARLVTIGMLAIALILVVVLSYDPIRREVLRQQAMGPALITIPKSETILGDSRYANGEDLEFLPKRSYKVEAFEIEPYEVTNQRYLLCVKAGKCSPPIESSSSYITKENANLPVVNITADQAVRFCAWLGRNLPSDIEWERAARFTDERSWPWGNSVPTAELANFFYVKAPSLQPTGQYAEGKSKEGVYDLAGNVWEWTRSGYEPNQPELKLDSAQQPNAISVRGGSNNINPKSVMQNTIAYRYAVETFTFDPAIGFRCVSK